MKWLQYVEENLEKESLLDAISFTMEDDCYVGETPPIIKMSTLLLEKLLTIGEKRIVFVFPEGRKLPFMFIFAEIISRFLSDENDFQYTPEVFKLGEKVKFENYVLEFIKVDDEPDGIRRVCVRTGDGVTKKMPVEWAPYFQKAETKRRLSKDRDVSAAINKFREKNSMDHIKSGVSKRGINSKLKNNITHHEKSVFSVAPIGRTERTLKTTKINGEQFEKLLLVAQADNEGKLKIKTPGQLSGIPPFTYGADLYAILEAVKQESSAELICIDGTNYSTLSNQLDALDELMQEGFPILINTDTANSFDLKYLEHRGFFVWRWDEQTLTYPLWKDESTLIGKRIGNCANYNYDFVECPKFCIDEAFEALTNCKEYLENATPDYSSFYSKVFYLAFKFLRSVRSFSSQEVTSYLNLIEDINKGIAKEARFNSKELRELLELATLKIKDFLLYENSFLKHKKLKEILIEKNNAWKKICLIIQDQAERDKYIKHWSDFLVDHDLKIEIDFKRQDEYVHDYWVQYDAVIVCGWLRWDRMQQVLFSHFSSEYLVLLYEHEKQWKNHKLNQWTSSLYKSYSEPKQIEIFEKLGFNFEGLTEKKEIINDTENDLLDEITITIQKNQFRPYIAGSDKEETTEAIPIRFAGDSFGFFRPNHELIDVTNIVLGKKSEIQMKEAVNINTGNLIVIREASRDIIRELADEILLKSGKKGSRELAARWKEAFKIALLFNDEAEIISKVQFAGCKKTRTTISQWIKNEGRIIPQDKEDIFFIATAMEDGVLKEMVDNIYAAGKDVQSAHIAAGRELSERLKRQIGIRLDERGIDPYNIWEPINLYIENIGNVRMLKVLERGTKIVVDTININRIIDQL